MTRDSRVWEVSFSLAMIALGLVVYWDMWKLEYVSVYDSAGPRLFPVVFASGIIICGIAGAAKALTQAPRAVDPMDFRPVAFICAGLAVQFFMLEWIGWIPAATLQFVFVSQAFGRFSIVRAVAFGLAFAVVTYVAFTSGLRIDLPPIPFTDRLSS